MSIKFLQELFCYKSLVFPKTLVLRNYIHNSSIRANQEVETLRTQIKLLEKQREEVQARLSEADDARSRSEAALTNLQIVLEQFQLGKYLK